MAPKRRSPKAASSRSKKLLKLCITEDRLEQEHLDGMDLSWAKPYLEEGPCRIEAGRTIPAEQVYAELRAKFSRPQRIVIYRIIFTKPRTRTCTRSATYFDDSGRTGSRRSICRRGSSRRLKPCGTHANATAITQRASSSDCAACQLGNYMIFYHVDDDTVSIVRVLPWLAQYYCETISP